MGVGQRPVRLGAPLVDAHYEDHYWRFGVNPVVVAAQPAVEPVQLDAGQVDRVRAGGWAELAVGEAAGEVGVGPRADDDALMGAGWFAAASPHVLEVLQSAPLEDVVPAADVEGGGGDLLVATVR